MTSRVFNDPKKIPTIFKQRRLWDPERYRLSLLDHLDDVYYAGLLERARIHTPQELYGLPPKHVLVVCGRCGIGVAESPVINGWTQLRECPKCHAWIKPETHRPQNIVTAEEMQKYAAVAP